MPNTSKMIAATNRTPEGENKINFFEASQKSFQLTATNREIPFGLECKDRQAETDRSSNPNSHQHSVWLVYCRGAAEQEWLSEGEQRQENEVHRRLATNGLAASQCNHCDDQDDQRDPEQLAVSRDP